MFTGFLILLASLRSPARC